MSPRQVPRGLYGPDRDGVADPQRPTIEQRVRTGPDWLDEQTERRASPSPMIRALQAATDQALARKETRQ